MARVPDNPSGGVVRVATQRGESDPHRISMGVEIADNLQGYRSDGPVRIVGAGAATTAPPSTRIGIGSLRNVT